MATSVLLQVVDEFLRQYSVGQALVLGLVLAVVAVLPLGSRKVLSLNVLGFGLLFLLLPGSLLGPFHFRLLGIALIVLGPLLYVTGRR